VASQIVAGTGVAASGAARAQARRETASGRHDGARDLGPGQAGARKHA